MKKTIIIIVFLILITPVFADAACPSTFQNVPFLNDGDCSTENFANALYQLAIVLAAILVVVRLIWAGAQYMLSEVITSKEAAKKEIRASLLGLLIILAAVTILNTINPQLTKRGFFSSAETIGTPSGTSYGGFTSTVSDPADFGRGDMFLNKNCAVGGTGAVVRVYVPCIEQYDPFEKSCVEKGGEFKYLPDRSSSNAYYFCLAPS